MLTLKYVKILKIFSPRITHMFYAEMRRSILPIHLPLPSITGSVLILLLTFPRSYASCNLFRSIRVKLATALTRLARLYLVR